MFAKVVVLCAALVAVNATGLLLGHKALISTGSSVSSRSQDAIGNYAFGYDIVDGHGASNSRSEIGDAHGNKKGSYTIHDIDGRARRVDYVADGLGFRAAVKTNEPGTAASAPAAAVIASPHAGPIAPVVSHVAPAAAVVSHAAVAAPLSHGLVGAAPLAHALIAPGLANHGLLAHGGHGLLAHEGHGLLTNGGHGLLAHGVHGLLAHGGHGLFAHGGHDLLAHGAVGHGLGHLALH
ncbi:adult-specific rigid cuticular protein 15.7-like [Stegodyphus dumicola]|uniref:adult-specific rigid cuticular protein 15.7-like n=1 Tax=Stegodyphus dumicola TaxID=202533 RepID=UPI0015AB6BC2|nr:adult-specific rigid cuticular protein 15.7-like [Stegodyphus dumicola]